MTLQYEDRWGCGVQNARGEIHSFLRNLFLSSEYLLYLYVTINYCINESAIMKEQVLKAMREAGKPVSAGDVTKALNADRKEVDKAFAELKKEGAIVSPVRCKWEPAQ